MSSPLRHNFDHTRRKDEHEHEHTRDDDKKRGMKLKMKMMTTTTATDNWKLEQKHKNHKNITTAHHHHHHLHNFRSIYDAFTQLPSEIIHDPPMAENHDEACMNMSSSAPHDDHDHNHKQCLCVLMMRKECYCATDRETQGSEEESESYFQSLQNGKDAHAHTHDYDHHDAVLLNEMGTFMRKRAKIRLMTCSKSCKQRRSSSPPSKINCDITGGNGDGDDFWKNDDGDGGQENGVFNNFPEKIMHSCSMMVTNVVRKMDFFHQESTSTSTVPLSSSSEEKWKWDFLVRSSNMMMTSNETKNNKNVIISSASRRRRRKTLFDQVTSSSNGVLGRLLSFILCSAFLMRSINYYQPQPVVGELISNPNYVNFLANNNYEGKVKDMDFVSSSSQTAASSSWSFLRSQQSKEIEQEPNSFQRNELDKHNHNNISSLPSSMKSASRENKRTDDDDDYNGSINGGRKAAAATALASSLQNPEEKLREMLNYPLDQIDKTILLETLWDAMTPEETRRIFGHKKKITSASSKLVPNFDVTKPIILNDPSPPHRHHVRRRRHAKASFNLIEEETENHLNPQDSSKPSSSSSSSAHKKLIQLEGLGRRFTMRLHPNQKLLDPYFVHLHRHENRSEILPHEIVRKQLNCFYHGQVEHGRKDNENNENAETGTVALSLCDGMKGFILPSLKDSTASDGGSGGGDGEQYHYVIHPLPNRLAKRVHTRGSLDQSKSASSSVYPNYGDTENEEGHSGHHIIFKRTGSFYPAEVAALLRKSEKFKKAGDNHKFRKAHEQLQSRDEENDNVEFHSCMHHDTVGAQGKQDSHAMGDDEDDVDESELEHRKLPITKFDGAGSNEYDNNVNDLKSSGGHEESLTPKMRIVSSTGGADRKLNSDSDDGDNFRTRRMKRAAAAPNFDTDTIDPFTYKTISRDNRGSSNWPRFSEYRGGGSSSTGPGNRDRFIQDSHYDHASHGDETRLSSQFNYNEGFKPPSRFTSTIDASGRVLANQNLFWHTNNRHSQTAPDNIRPRSRSHGVGVGNPRSRYDEIVTAPVSLEDSSVAGSDHLTWNRGILVFESSAIHENDKNVPFVTKGAVNGGKRSSRKETTSIVSTTSTRSSSNTGTGSPSFDWFSGRTGVGTYERPSSKSYSALKDPFTTSSSRKGRRDDGAFGSKWKSTLDSDSSWSDKSNEIGRQNKVDDLSQVKDRPPSHLTIETAVFIDKDLYKHMQQNFPEDTQGEVTAIVLAMINAVQLLYQDPSLGHRVDFVLKRLEVLETDPPTLIRPYDIDRFLTNFCKWQKTENPASDADPLHWDHALILTGLDLYVVHQSGKISNQVVGLAPVAGMCTRSSSCTVNEGKHFESVFVVAHEIGHNLGMRHDGPQAENQCDPTSHIMSPTLGSGKITWSPCSKKYLDMFLETAQAKCLFDAAKSEKWLDHNEDGRLPGERFDADRQCVLKYGRGSFHANQQPLEDVCRDLHCRREFFTWTSHPALDGTTCSPSGDMWCRSGKCVQKSNDWSLPISNNDHSLLSNKSSTYTGFYGSTNHLPGSETAAYATQKALDGGWGKWSPFTDCSSSCIYADDGKLPAGSTGVRLAARRCDSPRPENGGRQCSGPDRRYKTCSANSICAKSLTRTTLFQYANEVCTRASQVDADLSGRGYMSSSSEPEKACSVWCETNDKTGPRSRGWSFPDGTVCTLKTTPKNVQTYCVAGKCQEFSCNPYSIFRLSDEDCVSLQSNEIIQINPFERNRDSSGDGSWQVNTDSRSFGTRSNQRSGEVGWSDWETQSECKLACVAPAKGLQLVKRHCILGDTVCTGLSLSVKLCKPDKNVVQKNGCVRSQTPFEYATKVCAKYAKKVSGLSGIGMQLSPTKGDSDRPCRIGCQDANIPYRFYMVNGDEGWFPAGTDCSRGDRLKKAYCIAGKCVAFGDDDTPLYQTNTSLKESYLQLPRTKRQTVYNIMEPLKMDPSIDESSLKELVYKFSHETGNYPSITLQNAGRRRSDTVINRNANRGFSSRQLDLNSPSNGYLRSANYGKSLPETNVQGYPFHGLKRQSTYSGSNNSIPDVSNVKYKPVEGSYYEWRKIVSDCSVICGNGIQEVIVQCVSGNTVVTDAMCQERQRPGVSGYQNCFNRACVENPTYLSSSNQERGSQLWNWIQNALPKRNNNPNYS